MIQLIVALSALALQSVAQATDDWSDARDDKNYRLYARCDCGIRQGIA